MACHTREVARSVFIFYCPCGDLEGREAFLARTGRELVCFGGGGRLILGGTFSRIFSSQLLPPPPLLFFFLTLLVHNNDFVQSLSMGEYDPVPALLFLSMT